MNWLVDLGNTRLKWIAADADPIADVRSLTHVGLPDVAHALDAAFDSIAVGSTAWLASVAPSPITMAVTDALQQRGVQVIHVQTQAEFAGMRIVYATPSELGVDRFLSLIAAHVLGANKAWLIASVGTALTIDLLAADGQHLGGLIAPSPELMRQSLAQRASQLPASGGAVRDFADNTRDALASGSVLAARALIERSLAAAQRTPAGLPGLLLTGGGADALGDQWPVVPRREPNLVLHGLRAWVQAQPPSTASSR